MQRIVFYLLSIILVPITSFGQGIKGVAFHSDPRIDVLLKSKKTEEKSSLNPPIKKKENKSSVKILHNNSLEHEKTNKPKAEYKSTEIAIKNELSIDKSDKKHEDLEQHKPHETSITPEKKNVNLKNEKLIVQEHKIIKGASGGTKYTGKGFRVQIYNGPNRVEAIKRKADFMRTYPNIKTYLEYIAPHFKLKAGDYKNREEAIELFKEANKFYSPCMIVPDTISIK